MLLFIQLKLQLVFIALRVHCKLLSARVSKSFFAKLLPVQSAAVTLYRVFSFRNAENFTFVFVYKVPVGYFLQFVEVPLNGGLAFQRVDYFPHFMSSVSLLQMLSVLESKSVEDVAQY